MTRSAACLTLVLTLALATSAGAAVKRPRSGSLYQGAGRDVVMQIAGKSIELIAFSFPCDGTSGRVSLNAIRLRRSGRGYGFYSASHGLVTYKDEAPDENATVRIRGLFTRDAKRVRGRFRVITPRCGNTGRLRWRATRVKRLAN
jgi:hypothetical protein